MRHCQARRFVIRIFFQIFDPSSVRFHHLLSKGFCKPSFLSLGVLNNIRLVFLYILKKRDKRRDCPGRRRPLYNRTALNLPKPPGLGVCIKANEKQEKEYRKYMLHILKKLLRKKSFKESRCRGSDNAYNGPNRGANYNDSSYESDRKVRSCDTYGRMRPNPNRNCPTDD